MAIGAFAAAGIADADPMKTGLTAVRLAASLYIVPYMFAYAPELILIGDSMNIILCVVTAIIGIYAFSVALEGWLFEKVSVVWRILIGCAALFMIYPEHISDIVGIVVFGAYFGYSLIKRSKHKVAVG